MKKRDISNLPAQADQAETPKGLRRIDKMSMQFVLPLVLFYVVVGLLLILLNDLVTNIAAWALAAGLVVMGGWLLLRYIRSGMEERIAGMDMAAGLILLLAGILLICSPDDLEDVFPKIWGLSLVFGAFLKVQYAFDEKSVGVNRWWIMLIFAAASLAIGVLTLLNKSVFGDNQHLFIGAFMLGEAILDLVTYFLISRGMKKQNTEGGLSIPIQEALTEPAVPTQEAPAEPSVPAQEEASEE